jgi:DNA sulfur modification protein DndC
MLLGHRDSESLTRAHTLSVRLGKCPLLSDSCSTFYQTIDGDFVKTYPLRNWSEEDVWNYIDSWRKEMGDLLKQLYQLYSLPARYGCWHCTLVKTQLAHIALGKGHLYFEAVRKIYKALSDMPEFRAKKNYGYSKLGFLQAPARSLLLHSMLLAEKLSGIRLYGLDVSKI